MHISRKGIYRTERAKRFKKMKDKDKGNGQLNASHAFFIFLFFLSSP